MKEDFLIMAYHTKDSGYGYSIIRKSDDLDLGGLDEFKGLAEVVKHVQADITEINLAVKNKVEFGGFPLDVYHEILSEEVPDITPEDLEKRYFVALQETADMYESALTDIRYDPTEK